jgi:hypothetical protein
VRETAATLAGGGSVAGTMASEANFGEFDMLMRAYQEYLAMDAPARAAFLRESLAYKPVLGAPLFEQGPGDNAAFAAIYEIIRKLNHMLLVGRFFGTQEESGTSCILNAFTGDPVGIARTTIEDAHVSDATLYCLHSAFRALLQAYLLLRAAKEWRALCEDLFGHVGWKLVGRKLFACTSWAVRLLLSRLVTRFTSSVSMYHRGPDFCRYWRMRGLRGWWLFSTDLRSVNFAKGREP